MITDITVKEVNKYEEEVSRLAREWQNAAWIFESPSPYDSDSIREILGRMAKAYKQDSIAWTEGTTEFIAPSP